MDIIGCFISSSAVVIYFVRCEKCSTIFCQPERNKIAECNVCFEEEPLLYLINKWRSRKVEGKEIPARDEELQDEAVQRDHQPPLWLLPDMQGGKRKTKAKRKKEKK